MSDLVDEIFIALLRSAVIEAMPEHDDTQKMLGLFALQIYKGALDQGANEIEALATVYHAGLTHIREVMGMSYDDAVNL